MRPLTSSKAATAAPVTLAPADCGPPTSANDFGSAADSTASSIASARVGSLDDGIARGSPYFYVWTPALCVPLRIPFASFALKLTTGSHDKLASDTGPASPHYS